MKKIWKEFYLTLSNPIFVVGYVITTYLIYEIFNWGLFSCNKKLLLISIINFIVFFLVFMIRIIKNVILKRKEDEEDSKIDSSLYKKIIVPLGIGIIIVATIFYGGKTVLLIINNQGSISENINDYKSKTRVKFQHNNIFRYGIQGIFTDVEEVVDLPDEKYLVNTFDLEFDREGNITRFFTCIIGYNKEKELEVYVLTYKKGFTDKIVVEKGASGEDHEINDNKRLQPLIDTVALSPIEEAISLWDGDRFGIIYFGKRNWGEDTKGTVFIDYNGNMKTIQYVTAPIIGYTVSIFVPDKEDRITPIRYNLVDKIENVYQYSNENVIDPHNPNQGDEKNKLVSFISEKEGYKIEVTGTAMGSRWYGLYYTENEGKDWKYINEVTSLESGDALGMLFIDKDKGFVSLPRKSGQGSNLYKTEDGGKSFEIIEFNLPEGNASYDYPMVPKYEDGILTVEIGKGSDGDYGGDVVIVQSKDKGKSWQLIIE